MLQSKTQNILSNWNGNTCVKRISLYKQSQTDEHSPEQKVGKLSLGAT